MTKLTAKEMLIILNNQWATVNDIMLIGHVGKNKAQKIKREIKEELEASKINLPYGLVPMEKVVDYFKININYLKKVKEG